MFQPQNLLRIQSRFHYSNPFSLQFHAVTSASSGQPLGRFQGWSSRGGLSGGSRGGQVNVREPCRWPAAPQTSEAAWGAARGLGGSGGGGDRGSSEHSPRFRRTRCVSRRFSRKSAERRNASHWCRFDIPTLSGEFSIISWARGSARVISYLMSLGNL